MNQQINESTQSSKNIWLIIIAVVVVLIIGGGIYWWKSSTTRVQWVKYENSRCNYSLEYPENWVIETQNPLYVILNSPENEQAKQNIEPNQIRDSGYMPDITITYYSSVKMGLGVERLEEFVNKNPYLSDTKRINFAGTDKAWEMIMGGDREAYMIMVEHDSHLYQIGFNNRPKKSALTEIDNRIIKSFQFID